MKTSTDILKEYLDKTPDNELLERWNKIDEIDFEGPIIEEMYSIWEVYYFEKFYNPTPIKFESDINDKLTNLCGGEVVYALAA